MCLLAVEFKTNFVIKFHDMGHYSTPSVSTFNVEKCPTPGSIFNPGQNSSICLYIIYTNWFAVCKLCKSKLLFNIFMMFIP